MKLQTETKPLKGIQLIDCPGCDGKMPDGKYICSWCERENDYRSKTPPLMASEPEYHPKVGGRTGGCVSCDPERVEDCHERVRNDWVCACERFDLLDAITIGIADSDELKKYLGTNGKIKWNKNA